MSTSIAGLVMCSLVQASRFRFVSDGVVAVVLVAVVVAVVVAVIVDADADVDIDVGVVRF